MFEKPLDIYCQSEKIANIIEHAELRIISGTGHEVNVEAPEILAEVLCAFYEKVS